MKRFHTRLLCLALCSGFASMAQAQAQATAAACAPMEQRDAEAPRQKPSFAGQTRACPAQPASPLLDVQVLARGLQHPWAVEPLPGGDLLVTERPGRLRIVSAQGELGEPIEGLPAVDAKGQGGLLDVTLSPSFATDRTLYWSYAEPRDGGNGTSIAKGVLSEDRRRLEEVKVILRTRPTYDGDKHFGSRLAFGPDGYLYVTLGERSDRPMRTQSQDLGSHLGKILRIKTDGSAAPDNPFARTAGALPDIWTLGQRNVQAAAFDSQGRFWVVEMGTRGGDELNLIERGKNYGWPVAAYGVEYSGLPIAGAQVSREGMTPPRYYWDPNIAPSGAQFHDGTGAPAWKGNLFVGALKDRALVRLTLQGDRVTGEERLLTERGKRIRDVRQGADGALYLVTDESRGELWRVSPRATGPRPAASQP